MRICAGNEIEMTQIQIAQEVKFVKAVIIKTGVTLVIKSMGIAPVGPVAIMEVPEIGTGQTQISIQEMKSLLKKHNVRLSKKQRISLRYFKLISKSTALATEEEPTTKLNFWGERNMEIPTRDVRLSPEERARIEIGA